MFCKTTRFLKAKTKSDSSFYFYSISQVQGLANSGHSVFTVSMFSDITTESTYYYDGLSGNTAYKNVYQELYRMGVSLIP